MSSIVDLVERIDRLSLDTAHGKLMLDVVGMESRNALCIQAIGPKAVVNSEAIADIMVAVPGFPTKHLEFLRADESSSMAWFRVKSNGGK